MTKAELIAEVESLRGQLAELQTEVAAHRAWVVTMERWSATMLAAQQTLLETIKESFDMDPADFWKET